MSQSMEIGDRVVSRDYPESRIHGIVMRKNESVVTVRWIGYGDWHEHTYRDDDDSFLILERGE